MAVRRNTKIRTLSISENFLSPACFHILRDVIVKQNKIKVLKLCCASSDRLFNEMFLELQRLFEELIRKGSELSLQTLHVSKGNPIDF